MLLLLRKLPNIRQSRFKYWFGSVRWQRLPDLWRYWFLGAIITIIISPSENNRCDVWRDLGWLHVRNWYKWCFVEDNCL
jgi:hypothetical protein